MMLENEEILVNLFVHAKFLEKKSSVLKDLFILSVNRLKNGFHRIFYQHENKRYAFK